MFQCFKINNDRLFERLSLKFLLHNLSQDEEVKLKKWVNQDPQYEKYLQDAALIWKQTSLVDPPEMPKLDEEWSQLACRLRLSTHRKPKRQFSLRAFIQDHIQAIEVRTRWALVAAAVSVIAAISIFHNFQPVPIQAIATETAEKRYVRLPDGSEVWLNTVSEIHYPEKFAGKRREIELTGEAYFVIVPDSKPFIVNTNNARTEVLGTAFNVWSRNNETRVIVKRGKVQLSRSEEDTVCVDLVRDQMSSIAESQPPEVPQIVDAEYQIGWMEGRLLFEKMTLEDILDELQRYYGVKVELKDKVLSQRTMTAIFENRTLETVLTSLSLSLDTDYSYQSDELIYFGIK